MKGWVRWVLTSSNASGISPSDASGLLPSNAGGLLPSNASGLLPAVSDLFRRMIRRHAIAILIRLEGDGSPALVPPETR